MHGPANESGLGMECVVWFVLMLLLLLLLLLIVVRLCNAGLVDPWTVEVGGNVRLALLEADRNATPSEMNLV